MGTPIKIRLRKFFRELKCPHRRYVRRRKTYIHMECKCVDCGKVWIE